MLAKNDSISRDCLSGPHLSRRWKLGETSIDPLETKAASVTSP